MNIEVLKCDNNHAVTENQQLVLIASISIMAAVLGLSSLHKICLDIQDSKVLHFKYFKVLQESQPSEKKNLQIFSS